MSQQAIIKLVELAKKDEALLGELQSAKTPEEKAAVAARHGCEVPAEEFASLQAMAGKGGSGELSEAELDLVAGGFSLSGAWHWVKEHVFASGKDGNKVVGVKGKF